MRIMIVDDDSTERLTMQRRLSRLDIETDLVEGRLESLQALAERFRQSGADVAIVDHKLKEANFAPFLGAEAVAYLGRLGMPAVLITRFAEADGQYIRLKADAIPSYLRREDFRDAPERVVEAARRAIRVVQDGAEENDQTKRKTVLHVADVVTDESGQWVDVIINSWDPDRPVRLLVNDISPHLLNAPGLVPGANLVGRVTTSAKHPEMLVVSDLSLALTQPDDDGVISVEPPA